MSFDNEPMVRTMEPGILAPAGRECRSGRSARLPPDIRLADEQEMTAALIKERDHAVRIAKGGTAWRRIGRATKWLLIGAAALAAKSAH